MTIIYHKEFIKTFKKLSPKQKKRFKEKLLLLNQDEFHPLLNNHPLTGKYLGYRSINVTGDLRALYKKLADVVIFVIIDKHSNLYG